MKLIIQIPAWNEEEHLPETLAALPSSIDGIDEIEVLVVDDGSTDRTAEVAREAGAEVVRMPVHRGLAVAFSTGLRNAVERGADVIVNTDADNQYDARDIPALVQPILDGSAQMVIGDRQVATLRHFSSMKRLLQKLGSWVVRRLSGTSVRDATSGFRAISRTAALRLHVFTRFTYTLETILQAGEAGLKVVSVPVRVNAGQRRPSRLFQSDFGYVLRSLASMARIVILYNPLAHLPHAGCGPGRSWLCPAAAIPLFLLRRDFAGRARAVADPGCDPDRHRRPGVAGRRHGRSHCGQSATPRGAGGAAT